MSKKNTTTTIHLSEEVYNYLTQLREKNFVSISKYIDSLVQQAMKEVKNYV